MANITNLPSSSFSSSLPDLAIEGVSEDNAVVRVYYGSVTIRTALKNSLNVAAVSLLNKIGVQAARDYLQKTGIPLEIIHNN